LKKGVERPPEKVNWRQKHHCSKCGILRPDEFIELGWTKFNAPRAEIRCPNCRKARAPYIGVGDCTVCGKVRGNKVEGAHKYMGGVFNGTGPTSRCGSCSAKASKRRREELEEDSDEELVCAQCGTVRPLNYAELGWTTVSLPRSAIKCLNCRGRVKIVVGRPPKVENTGDCRICGKVRGARIASTQSNPNPTYEGGQFYGKGSDTVCGPCYRHERYMRQQEEKKNGTKSDKPLQPKTEEYKGDCQVCGKVRGARVGKAKYQGGYFYGTGPTSLCDRCYRIKKDNSRWDQKSGVRNQKEQPEEPEPEDSDE
jgi:hypothetical protein